jgi:FAD/FMN-containing dehydrogenase
LIETGVCLDGALAQDSSQIQGMWGVREGIPEACSKDGAVYKVSNYSLTQKYDISLPLPELYSLVRAVEQRLKEAGLVHGY